MRYLTALLVSLLIPAVPVLGQENLLTNGTFDERLTGWSHLDLVSWSEEGAAHGGSARISFPNRPQGGDALIQCVSLEGGRLYDLAASVLLPRSEGSSGGVSVRLQWHSLGNCQGPILRGAPSLDFGFREPAGWQTLEERRIPAPLDAASALLVVIPHSAGGRPYAIHIDDLRLARSVEFEEAVIPAVASATGARGERFETDLWVHNPAPATREFVLRLRRNGGPSLPVVLRVGPRQTRYIRDVISVITSRQDVTGALEVSYDPRGGPMLVSARVVTTHEESPGNGTAIPALSRKAARTSTLFPGLSLERGDTVSFNRVNAGAYNPNPVPVPLTFELVDGNGRSLGQIERVLEPGGWLQVNDVFQDAGADPSSTEGAYLIATSHIPVFPFVITVDNRSGDGTWVTPQDIPSGLLPRS